MGNESFDAWVDLDSGNNLTVRRVYGTNFDEPLARQDGSGTVQWYGRDHLGSVRQVFDNSTGAAVSTVDFDASGVVLSGTRVDRYGFTGREWDETLGLQYSRARMYNPATGRWLQEDPLGHGAGDANLYRYVGNDPKNWIDPSGLAEAGGPGTQELIDWGTSLYDQYQQANSGSQPQGPRDPEVMLMPMVPDQPRYLHFNENFEPILPTPHTMLLPYRPDENENIPHTMNPIMQYDRHGNPIKNEPRKFDRDKFLNQWLEDRQAEANGQMILRDKDGNVRAIGPKPEWQPVNLVQPPGENGPGAAAPPPTQSGPSGQAMADGPGGTIQKSELPFQPPPKANIQTGPNNTVDVRKYWTPTESLGAAFFWGVTSTGTKVVGNGFINTVNDIYTMGGLIDLPKIPNIEYSEYDKQNSAIELAEMSATFGFSVLTWIIPGGICGKAGVLNKMLKGYAIWDFAGNVGNLAVSIQLLYHQGLSVQNVGQVLAAGLSLGGNLFRKLRGPICFPADTPVHSELGLRPIGELTSGDRVWSFDFQTGEWRLCTVECRHDTDRDGPIVRVTTADETIRMTTGHPVWVVRGDGLFDRPDCTELAPDEDRGGALDGRWVHSEDLRPGDVIFLRMRGISTVREVRVESVRTWVCNLTVLDLHTYAVGIGGMLVHNTSGEDCAPKIDTPKIGPKETFRNPADAIGDLQGTAKQVGSGNTTNQQWIEWGYTVTH